MINNSGDKLIKEQVDNMQVSFDKEAAWMRLQDRLESKDEKKGYFRMGWAAAAILIVATVLWYSLSGDIKQPVVNIMPKAAQSIRLEESKKELTEPVIENIEPIIVHHQEQGERIAIKKKVSKPEVIEKIPEPVIVKEETPVIKEIPKVVAAPKPKMRTVHINEVIEEEYIERRISNSKYATEDSHIFQRRTLYKQEYDPRPDNSQKALFTDYNDDPRTIQN